MFRLLSKLLSSLRPELPVRRWAIPSYDRFTDRARKILQLADEEAQRFNHEYIGTEHLLLGLTREGSGVGANVLKNLGVDLHKIRIEVEKLVLSGPDPVAKGKRPYTPRAKKVIDYAREEASSLNHAYIGSEHLLLGLLREEDGAAAQVLVKLGLKLEDVRGEVCKLLGIHSELADGGKQLRSPGQRAKCDRFTDRARKIMQLANQEAQRFNHEHVGTEHVLLGLIKEGSGVGANVLTNLNLDLRKIRIKVEKLVPSGLDMVTMGWLPQTPRAKKVIEYSREEARNLNHNFVGTEHLLLGLLREEIGVAAQVLMSFKLKLDDVRNEVCRLLGNRTETTDGGESSPEAGRPSKE